jgi:hypothetical protein
MPKIVRTDRPPPRPDRGEYAAAAGQGVATPTRPGDFGDNL